MTTGRRWTRDQLLVAFSLYCRIPFGVISSRNPEIVRYSAAIGRTPSALSMKMGNIASLDDVIRESGRSGLRNASAADRAMWAEMNEDWEAFALECERALAAVGLDSMSGNDEQLGDPNAEFGDASRVADDQVMYPAGEDRVEVRRARVGQRFFRAAVMSAYDGRCCVTGLSIPILLEASHIVPWRLDAAQRTNPRNGLLLSALHHKAFDGGLITLGDDLTLRVSEGVADVDDRFFADAVVRYAGRRIRPPEKFAPDAEFLTYHRENVFLG